VHQLEQLGYIVTITPKEACAGYLGHPFAKLVVCVSMLSRFYHVPWCIYEIAEKIENRYPHDQYTFMKMPTPCSSNTTCSSGTSGKTRTTLFQTLLVQAQSMWSANLLHPSFSERAFQRVCHLSVVMVYPTEDWNSDHLITLVMQGADGTGSSGICC
jgi:hypothetical protein